MHSVLESTARTASEVPLEHELSAPVEDRAPAAGIGGAPPRPSDYPTVGALFDYQRDVWERAVLFWDTLRQRADNMLAHERTGKPPVLDFDYEVVLDARRLARPANYALLRITRYADECLEDCLDPTKPPVIVIDPRAGHGPGIGGFKRESEVGIALHEGYPVYFVIFYPEPCEGQTLADVLHALRRFVGRVSELHGGRAPVLYGNCQAGWAATILAADCEGLAGPIVLNGSPLSYWAGESGLNPARVSGGLLGGVWLAHLAADVGGGRFDGAWLVQNFENLKPESVWDKYADLFLNVDHERDRFLDFERWWNGFYFLSREEILEIVNNLFIGDLLEQGRLQVCADCFVDLRRIRNPLVIFASYGDNITPPHQALGWIPIVYGDTEKLKNAGQRIVYLINRHIGHLGIFVSANVARLEHRAILESLPRVAELRPGLYEMKIDGTAGDATCGEEAYSVRFEERQVEDLLFQSDTQAFRRVSEISQRIDRAYSSTLGPWVRLFSNPYGAFSLEWLHPMRTSRYAFATCWGPWQQSIAELATYVRANRHGISNDHPLKMVEARTIATVHDIIESARKVRDQQYEKLFQMLYGASKSPAEASLHSGRKPVHT